MPSCRAGISAPGVAAALDAAAEVAVQAWLRPALDAAEAAVPDVAAVAEVARVSPQPAPDGAVAPPGAAAALLGVVAAMA